MKAQTGLLVAADLGRSPLLGWLVAGVHVCAVLSLFPLDIPAYLKLAGAAALAASLVYHLRRDVLRSAHGAAVRIELRRDLTGEMELLDGTRCKGSLAHSSFASPWFASIVFRVEGERRLLTTVVFRDALGAEDFRALRVALRWGGA